MSVKPSNHTSKRTLINISLVLIVIAIVGMTLRQALLLKDIAKLDSIWSVTVTSMFQAKAENAELSIAPPIDTPYARVVAQNFQHPGVKLVRQNPDQTGNRRLIRFKANDIGLFEVTSDYTVQLKSAESVGALSLQFPIDEQKRAGYLDNNVDLQLDNPILEQISNQLNKDVEDIDLLADKIFDYVHERIVSVKGESNNDVIRALETSRTNDLGKVRTLIALSRAANIPARLVTGFVLDEDFDAKQIYWAELVLQEQWIGYDPLKGYKRSIPSHYLPMRRSDPLIVAVSENSSVSNEYEISQLIDRKGYFTNKQPTAVDILNLNRLSLETRQTLAILMLLPLGALFTTLVRTLLGIKTYGTFTPALIGLAASYADWITAVMIFVVVAIVGLSGRHFIHGHLLRAPRLTIVFTLVAVAMILGVSILDYYQLSSSGHVVLLPIVILTTLVDRIYTTTDERGLHTAMVRLGWTLAVALVCLGIVKQEWLGHLILQYPESQLITIALILLLSTYKGRNFLDHFPIKGLIEPEPEAKAKTIKKSTANPDVETDSTDNTIQSDFPRNDKPA